MRQTRLEKVFGRMSQMGLEQMIITDAVSIFYLTGIWVDAGERLVALYVNRSGRCRFFVNNMFSLPDDPGVDIIRFSDTDPYMDMLADCVDKDKPLGVDKNMPARFLLPLISGGCGTEYINASVCVDKVRAVKDEEEKDAMRKVSAINDQAMEQFKMLLKEGVTEREVSNQMKEIYQNLGADDLSFPPSVCFGPNAAVGHYRSGNVPLKRGDCILLDVGCKKDSYCADMTRTFFCGNVGKEEHRTVYELVRKANQEAEAIIKPGVRLCDIDAAARKVIEDAGYGSRFTHRLGHFIGLEVHDFGDVSSANQETAQPGNIFSIEPGIYLEGDMGVRIEDLVLVTEDGCEILNSYSKELEIV